MDKSDLRQASYRRSRILPYRFRWLFSKFGSLLDRSGRHYRRLEVPEPFHERFIDTLYRHPRSTMSECVGSLLRKNNETFNCWTHLVAAVVFITILIYFRIPLIYDRLMGPMLTLALGACIYTVGSTSAHTFNTMSVQARHACFFCDYAAVSTYAFSVGVAYGACSLPLDWAASAYGKMFIPFAFVLATLSTVLSSQSRFLKQAGECAIFRIIAFGLPYMHETVPLFVRIGRAGSDIVNDQALVWHVCHISCAMIATPCFGLHFPERSFKEVFSFIGHSHQIMHTLGAVGTVFQLLAVVQDIEDRRDLFSFSESYPSHATCLSLLGLYLVINCFITAAYIIRSKTQLRIDGEELYCCCSNKSKDNKEKELNKQLMKSTQCDEKLKLACEDDNDNLQLVSSTQRL